MDWRWKGYNVNMPEMDAQVVDPQGVQAYQNGEVFDRVDGRMQLRKLEAQLAEIDEKIAAFDRANPGYGTDAAEIAAKRAEMGDFSAYDNMVNRQGMQGNDPTAIENELYNAEKLTWGLKSKSSEDKEIALANIEASLRRAEEWADKTGAKLPMSYYRLKEMVEMAKGTVKPQTQGMPQNELEWLNTLYTKADKKTLTDNDIKAMKKYIADNPGSQLSEKLQELVSKYKWRTNESKAKAEIEKQKAKNLFSSIANLPLNEQVRTFNSWSNDQKNAFRKYYKIDPKTGAGALNG